MSRKFLVSIDLNKNELQNAVIQNLATAPATPLAGQVYYNTVDNQLYIYNGTRWEVAGNAVQSGLLSARPAAGSVDTGTIYYATDNYLFYYSDGSTWQQTNAFGNVVTETSYGQASGNGTATNYARADHTHGTPALGTATPNAIAGVTGSAGSATTPSKEDHTHAFTPAADLSMAGFKLTNVGTPSADTDADATANGIYTVNASGAPTRSTDMNVGSEFPSAYVFVEQGTVNADTGWVCTNNAPVTLGSTNITWTQFSGAGTYTANNGVVLNGSVFSFAPESGKGLQTGASGAAIKLATTSGLNVTSDLAVGAGNGISVLTNTVAIDSAVVVSKYAASVGDGSATSYTVTHNLNTRDVIVTVYDNSAPYAEVITDVAHTTVNTVTIAFSVAPTSNQYRVVVHA